MWHTSNASARAAALDALAASARDAPTAARLLRAPKLQPALEVPSRSPRRSLPAACGTTRHAP